MTDLDTKTPRALLPREGPTGHETIEQVLGGFLAVDDAAPYWLLKAQQGQRYTLDRLYPELGLAIQFKNPSLPLRSARADRNETLKALCRREGIALVEVDPSGSIAAQTLVEVHTALSAASRRVAQGRGARETKLDLMTRIAAAKAVCQRLLVTATQPTPSYRSSRWQRRQKRIQASWRRFSTSWQLFAQNRLAVLGLVLIVFFGLMAIAHPVLRATAWKKGIYDPVTGYDLELMHPAKPSSQHLLGTDSLGRDVLSMLLHATTSAFIMGIVAAVSTAVIGVMIGVTAAYYRGAVDVLLTHVADAFLLLPAPLFMVMVGMRFRDIGPVPLGLIYGLIAGAGGAAIVMRSHALTVAAKPFIEAARVAGGGGRRIMLKHILPHMLPLAALYMMLAVTGAVVADAFVSFWGFSRSYLNWGAVIYSSFTYSTVLDTGVEWHVLIPPSVALSLFAAAFYFVARGLHEVADPRLRAK